jgi:hypothetical protein
LRFNLLRSFELKIQTLDLTNYFYPLSISTSIFSFVVSRSTFRIHQCGFFVCLFVLNRGQWTKICCFTSQRDWLIWLTSLHSCIFLNYYQLLFELKLATLSLQDSSNFFWGSCVNNQIRNSLLKHNGETK